MQPGLHDYLREMHHEVFSRYKVLSVAEGAGNSFADAHDLVDAERKELNMAYAFDAVDIPKFEGYSLIDLKKTFSTWDSAFAEKGWLSIFLANHDQARMVSRFASDAPAHREPAAKMLNTFLLTMRGTPYCYFGDEIGMINSRFESIEDYQDIAAINGYKKVKFQGGDLDQYMRELQFGSRDYGRTPMQWNKEPHAGFTVGKPWLPLHPEYEMLNVEVQENKPQSVLNHFRMLTTLRKENPIFVYGSYQLLLPQHPHLYVYQRKWQGEQVIVALNFSQEAQLLDLEIPLANANVLVNNLESIQRSGDQITLLPFQAVVIKVK